LLLLIVVCAVGAFADFVRVPLNRRPNVRKSTFEHYGLQQYLQYKYAEKDANKGNGDQESLNNYMDAQYYGEIENRNASAEIWGRVRHGLF